MSLLPCSDGKRSSSLYLFCHVLMKSDLVLHVSFAMFWWKVIYFSRSLLPCSDETRSSSPCLFCRVLMKSDLVLYFSFAMLHWKRPMRSLLPCSVEQWREIRRRDLDLSAPSLTLVTQARLLFHTCNRQQAMIAHVENVLWYGHVWDVDHDLLHCARCRSSPIALGMRLEIKIEGLSKYNTLYWLSRKGQYSPAYIGMQSE